MSRGYWGRFGAIVVLGLLIALLLVAFSLGVWKQYNLGRQAYQQYQETAEAKQKEATAKIADECQIFIPSNPAFRDCLVEKQATYQKQQYTNEDLKAQQDMAFWAFWTFVAGATGAVIAMGGLFALLVSLRQTATAIRDTRVIGEAEVRAYVSIESADIYFTGDVGMPFVHVIAVNNGQTPAKNFLFQPELRYLSEAEPQIERDIDPSWIIQPGIDIHPAKPSPHTFALDSFDLMAETGKWITRPRRIGISVIVHFAWADVFGNGYIDEASFCGVAEQRSVAANRKVHQLNTSKWFCKLHPIPKGEIWAGVAMGLPEPKKRKSQKRKS